MNSSVINILSIFNSARALRAVGFSSEYKFNKNRAEELFTEFVQNADLTSPLFSGILILESDENSTDYTIVDGLQRIITISLLLFALCDSIKNSSTKNDEARDKISTRYLLTKGEPKLKLKGEENNIYRKIITNDILSDEEKNSNLWVVYDMFAQKIKDKGVSYSLLFKIIANIQFMTVFIPREKIPLRELYQSINGTKDDCVQVRLITNYVNQISPEVGELWQEIVNSYKNDGLEGIMQYFIRDFLSTQSNGKAPNANNLYKSFNVYCKKMLAYQGMEQIIGNLKKYSDNYLKILKSDFENEEIRQQFIQLNDNNGQDAYPYLLEVIDDVMNNNISEEIFLELLGIINEFFDAKMRNPNFRADFESLKPELNRIIAQKVLSPNEKINIDLTNVKNISDENDDKNINKKMTINEITQKSTFEV